MSASFHHEDPEPHHMDPFDEDFPQQQVNNNSMVLPPLSAHDDTLNSKPVSHELPPLRQLPQIESKKQIQQQQPSSKDENTEVLRWKNINVFLIALTTFATIIFLQVLAYVVVSFILL